MASGPPKFIPIDPNAINADAIKYDNAYVQDANSRALQDFGSLYPTRNASIEDAYQNVAGVQDPAINSALEESGLGPVSLGDEFQQGRNLYGSRNIAQKYQRDRNYLSRLWDNNPEHGYGLNQTDLGNTLISNAGGQADFTQQILNTQAQVANQERLQNAQQTEAFGSIAGSIGKAASTLSTPSSNYLNPGFYTTNDAGNVGNPAYGTGGSGDYSSPPSDFGTNYDYTPYDSSGGY